MVAAALDRVEQLNTLIGRTVAWAYLPLIGVVVTIVVLRYFGGVTYVWLEELQWYIFAVIVSLGFGDAWSADAHVRVDLFYERLGERGRLWVNLLGAVLLAIPFALAITVYGWSYFVASWAIAEGSPNFSGLPARWLVKLVLFAGCALLLAQAVVVALRSALVLAARRPG